jgi:uncharacterized NAD-dependent epimerase/dehydratase family protein
MTRDVRPSGERQRVVLLCNDRFGPFTSKTAVAEIRYGRDEVVAIVDRSKMPADASEYIGPAGRGIPVVTSMEDALEHDPQAVIFGWAPEGGGLPPHDRDDLLKALRAGVMVVSGLHEFLEDDPEMRATADASGAAIVDLRRPPLRRHLLTGEGADHHAPVVLVSGTDCSTGKMTVAVELVREARRRGMDAAFVATGQSGMLVGADAGIAVDALTGDFMAGEVEHMVMEVDAKGPDLIVVEGQGALTHPAYGAVSLAILQGSFPDAVVMCHDPGRTHYKAFEGGLGSARIPPLRDEVALTEKMLENTSQGRVRAIAVMAVEEDVDQMTQLEEIIRATLGLPVADVFRNGAGPILDPVLEAIGDRGGGTR